MQLTPDANELLLQLPQIIIDKNVWWRSANLPTAYKGMKKRGFYQVLSPHLNFIELSHPLILHGHQKTGKSTMLMHLIDGLLGNDVNPHHILLIKISDCIQHNIDIKELIEEYLNYFESKNLDIKYLFIDDLELYTGWGDVLQFLYSKVMGIKFICTSSLIPSWRLNELKEFDFEIFMLPQLTFYEYVGMVGGESLHIDDEVEPIATDEIDRLNAFFHGYIKFVTDYTETPGKQESSLMEAFVNLFPGNMSFKLNHNHFSIWMFLLRNLSSIFSVEILASDTQTSVKEVNEFMELAQEYAIFHFLPQCVNEKKPEDQHFHRPLLINLSCIGLFLKGEFNIKKLDIHLLESVVHCQWEHVFPINLKCLNSESTDVSMIRFDADDHIQWLSVVTFSNDIKSDIERIARIADFCISRQIYFPVITTLDYYGFIEYKGVLFSFQPLAIYTYSVGRHILESRIMQ